MHPRLRAVCDLSMAKVRDQAGRHEYDGQPQDLSPATVAAGLDRLGGAPLDDAHDEAVLSAAEERLRVELGEIQTHRRSPRRLLETLDLAVYDRPYAPDDERAAARRAHLAAWPEAVEAGVTALDAVPAPVASALLPAVRGLRLAAEAADADAAVTRGALDAHDRLVDHLADAVATGEPSAALGTAALERLLGPGEARAVDVGRLAEQADAERQRLSQLLAEACAAIAPDATVAEVVVGLLADHPDADGVLAEARALTEEVIAFTRERGLVGDLDGTCVVATSPPSRRWATAMLSWPAPTEPDGPSLYWLTPPQPDWTAERQRQWLSAFNRSSLLATTVHEVAPGHHAHARWLRRVDGDVRRTLLSSAFVEGWAHYAEELCLEQGFRSGSPRFAASVALKALVRVVRLSVSIELHAGEIGLDEATRRFEAQAYYPGPVARAEAERATFDPTYGRYTLGKRRILDLRQRARRHWGSGFTLRRFHDALLGLGAPPLGLIDAALEAPPTP